MLYVYYFLHRYFKNLFIPQYLMTHPEQFALLEISEMKNGHNSNSAISSRNVGEGLFPRLSFLLTHFKFKFWFCLLSIMKVHLVCLGQKLLNLFHHSF